MCRLFAVFSTEPIDAAYPLKNAAQSLYVQSKADRKRLQGDGWGTGWFERGTPKIFKSPRPIYRDLAKLKRAGRHARGNTVVGHIRWASNPLKLPRKQLIGLPHTQPFTHKQWLFAHNGTLYIPREVRAELGRWSKFVKGKNDSEVLFYWLLKTFVSGKSRNWASKLRASLRGLDRIWQSCKHRYPIYRHPYHGVNWVLTDGRMFFAFCYVNRSGFGKARGFCSRQPYFQLQMQTTRRNIVVASEPIDRTPGWRPFVHGQLLIARRRDQQIITQLSRAV